LRRCKLPAPARRGKTALQANQSGNNSDKLTEDEKRFLSIRERILLRRNPQLLLQERRALEAMTDEELDAYLAPIGKAPPAG
jgi:hypothetical protein